MRGLGMTFLAPFVEQDSETGQSILPGRSAHTERAFQVALP